MFFNNYFNIGYNPFMPNIFGFGMPVFMPNFSYFRPTVSPYFSVFNFWNTPSLTTAYTDNQNYTNSSYNDYSSGLDTFKKATLSVSTDSNGSVSIDGYNKEAGQKLADIALKNAGDFHNHCAGHVEDDIEEAGLGRRSDADAYQMLDTMNNNPNFKPLETTNIDVSKLPAGCVPVYDKGVSGYSNDYGHIEITLGDGRAASDGITNNIRQNPTAIFAPVYA